MTSNAGSQTERKGQTQMKHITESHLKVLDNDTPSRKKCFRVLPADSQEALP